MDPLAGFALHLRSLREAQGLSVKSLADQVGVSSVTIWKWERGDSKPRTNFLSPLARALNVTAIELRDMRAAAELGDADPSALRAERSIAAEQAVAGTGEALVDVIARAKQMIAEASGTSPSSVTIQIEY